MQFTDRNVQFPNKRRLIKVDENNIPTGEPPIIVSLIKDEGAVYEEGMPVTAENLNKGNWRDDDSVSFKMRAGGLPDAKDGETQIVTASDGETWIIPPLGNGRAIKVSDSSGTRVRIKGCKRDNVCFVSDPQEQINDAKDTAHTAHEKAENALGTANSKVCQTVYNTHTADNRRHFTEEDRAKLEKMSVDAVYPVGSVYISTVDTNPHSLFGMGTWERFGNGRTLVGVDEKQEEFSVSGNFGGKKDHTLNMEEIPDHTHSVTIGDGGSHEHRHQIPKKTKGGVWSDEETFNKEFEDAWTEFGGIHTHTVSIGNAGGGRAHNNLQPYITVYMWKRTE